MIEKQHHQELTAYVSIVKYWLIVVSDNVYAAI